MFQNNIVVYNGIGDFVLDSGKSQTLILRPKNTHTNATDYEVPKISNRTGDFSLVLVTNTDYSSLFSINKIILQWSPKLLLGTGDLVLVTLNNTR